jgi:hypothetical protein
MTYSWHENQHTICIIYHSFVLIIRNVSERSSVRNKTHLMFGKFFFENRVVHEIMWKNIIQQQMTVWRMRIACWIKKATQTNTHTISLSPSLSLYIYISLRTCNKYCLSTATMVAWTRLNVSLSVHCLSCLLCSWHMEVSALKQVLICHYLLLNLLTVTTECDDVYFCCCLSPCYPDDLFMQ